MRQLLIVDDERHAVRGIKAGVEWETLGISVVHEAYNIRTAKEIMSDSKIDVLICDIEMPQGNGFELLDWVKIHYPQTEAMFLTCHADFSYAQKAIQLGSCDYMLKPVRYPELASTVKRALDKLTKADLDREKLQFADMYEHYYRLWESYQPMFMERFWQELLSRSIPSTKEGVREALAKHNIAYEELPHYKPVLISVQRWHKELTLREEKIMEYALRNSFEEMILAKSGLGRIIQVRSGALLALLPIRQEEDGEQLHEQIDSYIEACNRYFFCDLCCYMGSAVPVEEICDMYEQLAELESHNVTRTNERLSLTNCSVSPDVAPLPVMSGWGEMLKLGCGKEMLEEIEKYLDSVKHTGQADARWLRSFYEDFLQMVHQVLHAKGLRAHQVFSAMVLMKREDAVTRSITDLSEWVGVLIYEVSGNLNVMDETQTVVDKVKHYIAKHMSEDLSREDIASHVCLHPDYLARLFKKDTGLTISEYVLQERVALAKQMLAKTELAITSIAYELGYGNYSHFSKMFKKATSVGPQEYRKLQQSGQAKGS
ncbi:two-component system, response regulator YesN [Paenibacillus algorifonticola]|uniref:Two-component system, response regulator YesN n=1 Tax=Paenibacillus algorifonticola TaxID=684063 RepID=A0A1I2GQQ2_9BACL|nr:helix-turn-helix domain-containing protein [Paenibacillus algorifonticola]SFF18921.1 two-component system, response regulator YesN [Paenibacillus algorifonticola]